MDALPLDTSHASLHLVTRSLRGTKKGHGLIRDLCGRCLAMVSLLQSQWTHSVSALCRGVVVSWVLEVYGLAGGDVDSDLR